MKKGKKIIKRKSGPSLSFAGLFRGLIKPAASFLFLLPVKTVNSLPGRVKRYFLSSTVFLLAVISFFSLFDQAGKGGRLLKIFLLEWVGAVAYISPFIFLLSGIIFLRTAKRMLFAAFLAILLLVIGMAGLFGAEKSFFYSGGVVGNFISAYLISFFGELIAGLAFLTMILVGCFGFWYILRFEQVEEKKKEEAKSLVLETMKKMLDFSAKLKVSRLEPEKRMVVREERKIEQTKGIVVRSEGKQQMKLPPYDLLDQEKEKSQAGNTNENNAIIKKTLENFGIEAAMADIDVGPTVARYSLKPADNVKLSRITGLSNNLALALAAHPIRIEAPIPGKSLVGIEVPNKVRSKVRLRELMSSAEFRDKYSNLGFVLGRDVAGVSMFSDIGHLPHLLVAGATGSGKTIFLNCLVLSLLYRNTPQTLRFILIDPKRVEFSVYRDLPHLLGPVVYDAKQSVNVLSYLVDEMDRRFHLLSEAGVRNIFGFNEKAGKTGGNPLSYIVLIIDELADLMSVKGKEIEVRVVRIAQMARAVGIHLVLATQRPSTEVITGLIKANITSRVAFQVPTQIDSRTILDSAGAEKLLGLGDMLYVSAESVKPRRIQGAYVSEKEVKAVTDWIVDEMGTTSLLEDSTSVRLREYLEKASAISEENFDGLGEDPLYGQAKEAVIRTQKASASFLQRRLQVGYVRAARLLDMLEANGVIGPGEGAKPRKVYGGSSADNGLGAVELGSEFNADAESPVFGVASEELEDEDDVEEIAGTKETENTEGDIGIGEEEKEEEPRKKEEEFEM